MTETSEALVLDASGTDIQGESARIRARGSVTRVVLPGGVEAWSVVDATLLRGLLTDDRVSKEARKYWPAFIDGTITQDWILYTWVAVQNMFTAGGRDHARLRKLVSPAFTHLRTAEMQPRIEAITAELLDNLAQTPAGEAVDLREGFAYPLPIAVISALMGVPPELNSGLRTCVDGIFSTTLTPEEAVANYEEMYRILYALVDLRRREPGPDITSLLITHHEADGDRLAEQELVDTLLLIISAGHETTVNLLDQAICILLNQPQHLAALAEGRITWPDVIEETLRFEAPVAHLPLRYATEDIQVGDVLIKQGEAILASYAGANRDPEVYGDTADEFDPTRSDKRSHLSFGYGIHHCLGAPLARLEAVVSLPALFERFPQMQLAPGTELQPLASGLISNGHSAIPVVLTPASAE